MPDDVARTAQLTIDLEAGPVTTVRLAGDLDPATAPLLDEALAPVVDDATVDKVVLDLGGLAFLDSSGLRVFVTTREKLMERGGELALRHPSENISRLLDITGLGEIIEVDG